MNVTVLVRLIATPYTWLGALSVMSLVVFAWRLWWRLQAQWLLERRAVTDLPRIERIGVQTIRANLYPRALMQLVAQRLRDRSEQQTDDLDIHRTIEATIDQGGHLTAVYAKRRHVPEYLVLIERASFQDQLAQLSADMVRRLIDNEVYSEVFYFDRDPRFCAPAGLHRDRPGPAPEDPLVSLSQLAAMYHASRLLIFSDASTFISGLSGQAEVWVSALKEWHYRAVVTPVPRAAWGHREMLIRKHFDVVPCVPEALIDLTDRWNGREPIPDDTRQIEPMMADELRVRGERWTYREQPKEADAAAIVGAAEQYLGPDGFLWLCACCVYPTVNWNLTLLLGASLKASDGSPLLSMDRLRALVQLPWFRYGNVPDWLRRKFLQRLNRQKKKEVHSVIDRLLVSALAAPEDPFQLEIAHQPRTLRGLSKALLRALSSEPDPEATYQEHVFLDFMLNSRRQLAVQVPSAVAGYLVDKFSEAQTWQRRRAYIRRFDPPFFGRPSDNSNKVATAPRTYGGAYKPWVDQRVDLARLGWSALAHAKGRKAVQARIPPRILMFGMKPIPYRSPLESDPATTEVDQLQLERLPDFSVVFTAVFLFVLATVATSIAFLASLPKP
jgi:hypothetical protein